MAELRLPHRVEDKVLKLQVHLQVKLVRADLELPGPQDLRELMEIMETTEPQVLTEITDLTHQLDNSLPQQISALIAHQELQVKQVARVPKVQTVNPVVQEMTEHLVAVLRQANPVLQDLQVETEIQVKPVPLDNQANLPKHPELQDQQAQQAHRDNQVQTVNQVRQDLPHQALQAQLEMQEPQEAQEMQDLPAKLVETEKQEAAGAAIIALPPEPLLVIKFRLFNIDTQPKFVAMLRNLISISIFPLFISYKTKK